jgi:pantetheine-phosphate adenylyltransferase
MPSTRPRAGGMAARSPRSRPARRVTRGPSPTAHREAYPVAVYPGSFDPITNGHVDIIRRSLRVFPSLTVAIAYNQHKDAAMFTPAERIEMIREVLRDVGDRVRVDSFSGLLVDYAERVGAEVIVRGLRAVSDFEYEFEMTMMNRHLKPHIETVFMMADEQYFYTSSRRVKEVASFGGDVRKFVPDFVLERFGARFQRGSRD